MRLFDFIPHPTLSDFYDICNKTGVLRYKLAEQRSYGDSYFMEEYQNQYQKTYYEDESNLRMMAIRRLKVLRDIFQNQTKGKKLLEIGSAAGFFLDEAAISGFETIGYELSKREVEYSVTKLKLEVVSDSILNVPIDAYAKQFDVICAFFVIEHMQEIDAIWERISLWTRPGGVLFFAVPSFFGPTFQTNPKHWLDTHPKDHFYDYDLRSTKKLLSKLGFDLRYARPMSYHPKRDLGLRGRLPNWAYKLYSNLTCYADTIEVAFQKTKL